MQNEFDFNDKMMQLTELTARVTCLLLVRSSFVTDMTQQPQPPSLHMTFVPSCKSEESTVIVTFFTYV